MLARIVCGCLLIPSLLHAAVHLSSVRQFGGTEADTLAAMTRDSSGNLYLTGTTYSFDFPANASQAHPASSNLWLFSLSAAKPVFSHNAGLIYSAAPDRAHPGTAFLWTDHGLLRTTDSGQTWAAIGSELPPPNGGAIAVDPQGRNLYLADPATGIYRSTDASGTWTLVKHDTQFNQVYADPFDPNVVIAAGASVLRSTDAGATWQVINSPFRVLAFDPKNAGVVYAATNTSLFRSSDHGATWTLKTPGTSISYLTVDTGGTVYYAQVGSGTGISSSADGGNTWTNHSTGGYVFGLGASDAAYVVSDTHLLKSTDGFASYTRIGEITPASGFAFLPGGAFFVYGNGNGADAYVMKLDPSGNRTWATYLGGSFTDTARSIAVDGLGQVYVGGLTASPDFPVTEGAVSAYPHSQSYVAKYSTDGTLLYSATLADARTINAIAVDQQGSVYAAGTLAVFIPTGLFSFAQPYATVCKLNALGSQILFCKQLDQGEGTSIALDSGGNVFIAGDRQLWKLDSNGTVIYRRDIPGTVRAIAVDPQDGIYIAGNTTTADFPTTPGAFQQQFQVNRLSIAGQLVANSADHGFIQHLDSTGATIASTLFEGENWDHILSLAIGRDGDITIGGTTASDSLPLRGAIQTRFGYQTGFVARLSADLTQLIFSTYVGDTRNFQVSSVVVGDDGQAIFAGDTTNANSRVLHTDTPLSTGDIFVASLAPAPTVTPSIEAVLNSASLAGTRIAPNQSITVVAPGAGSDAQILLDGSPLETLSTDAGKVTARIPIDYSSPAAVAVQVQSAGSRSDPLLVQGAAFAPAIYTKDGSGLGEALVFHEDGSLNSPENPATPGSVIAVACNGVGHLTFNGPYAVVDTPVSVYVDGIYAQGVDAHMLKLPGIPGDTYVIRVKVPQPTQFKMPPLVSLTLNIGGTSNTSGILSQADVGISIAQ